MSAAPLAPKDPHVSAPAQPHPADDFAETIQLFWAKNGNAVLGVCAAVILAVCVRYGWAWYVENREASVGQEYAAAGDKTDKLKAFVASHEGHQLSGVALLRVADEAFVARKYADAEASYEKALPLIKELPFGGRAKLGLAMSKLLGGKPEGEQALKQLAGDASQYKGLRAEACYHLASRASEKGRVEEVKTLVDQLMQIDSAGMWAQRGMMLRATLPGK
jgi:predicted negative regulator of RcsB-dependent stress response